MRSFVVYLRRPQPKPATPLVRGARPLRVELTRSQLVSGTVAPGARVPVAPSTAFWRRPPVHGTGREGALRVDLAVRRTVWLRPLFAHSGLLE